VDSGLRSWVFSSKKKGSGGKRAHPDQFSAS
jgi:hypothetical protein